MKFVSPPSNTTALRNIRHLDLAGNIFGIEATKVIGAIVMHAPKLTRLSLHGCFLGGPDLYALVHVLLKCDTLRDLDFSSNYSDEDGKAWEAFVSQSKRIERLLLTDNQMPVHITGCIIDAAVHSPNRNLHIFQIGGQSKVPPLANQVLPSGLTALATTLRRNRFANETNEPSEIAVPPTPIAFDKPKSQAKGQHPPRSRPIFDSRPAGPPGRAPPPPPGPPPPPPNAMHGVEFSPHMMHPLQPTMYAMPQQQFVVMSGSGTEQFMTSSPHVVLMPPGASLGQSPVVLLTSSQSSSLSSAQQVPGGMVVVTHPQNFFGIVET